MRYLLLLLCPALVLGCSSGSYESEPLFTPSGIVAHRPPIDTCTNGDTTGPLLAVIVHLSAVDTAVLQEDPCTTKASSKEVGIFLWKSVASGDIAPGTYPIRDSASAGQAAFWYEVDSACNRAGPNVLAIYGTVIIETNDATHVVGSVDVTFPGGKYLRTNFDAPVVAPPHSVCGFFGFAGGTPGPGCPNIPCLP